MKSSHKVPVLILGGGLAGLSTAYHLGKIPNTVIEREAHPGGTARSFSIEGFTFDVTGHLLHLHNPYTKKLILQLLKGKLFSCVRKTFIFSENTYTKYPYQANTFGLPESSVSDCVLGFFSAYLKNLDKKKDFSDLNFLNWSQSIFGKGITEKFMRPYNEKLFQIPARKMTVEWCGPFVPNPQLDEVVKGALLSQDKRFGYNATFYYPKTGGIQALAESLAPKIPSLQTNTTIKKIDLKNKKALLSSGIWVSYSYLVNTIPLVELLKIMGPLPQSIRSAKKKLKHVSVLCLNVGVNRARISKKSWIYFPEKEFPFYRVGFPMNFTPHVVPKGCSSMYIEVPWKTARKKSKAQMIKEVKAGLVKARILKPSDRLPVVQYLPIRYAYVVYNKDRAPALKNIFSFLKSHGIQSVGRYGGWKYSFMEEALLDGKKAAETICRKMRPK